MGLGDSLDLVPIGTWHALGSSLISLDSQDLQERGMEMGASRNGGALSYSRCGTRPAENSSLFVNACLVRIFLPFFSSSI
jgi:hypothetical protein